MPVEGDGAATLVVLDRGKELAQLPLVPRRRLDIDVVEAIARFELAARAFGWSVVIRQPCADLVRLVRLAGLDEVLHLEGADPP